VCLVVVRWRKRVIGFYRADFLVPFGLLLRSWIGFKGRDHHFITDHFTQFIFSTDGLKSRRSFLQLVWFLAIWTLWNERNNRLFNNKESSIFHLLDKIKSYSLWCQKAKKTVFVFGENLWWASPLSCLGID
jgi:hypothetical protein